MGMADYAYSNTRIRVMKGLLLESSDLEALSRAKNLNDYLIYLKQTHYGEVFSRLDKASIREIEKHLIIDLMKTVDTVTKISPQYCVPFINAVSRRYQIEYIKLILNLKKSGLSPEEIRSRMPLEEIECLLDHGHKEKMLSRLTDLPFEGVRTLLCDSYPGLDEFMQGLSEPLDMLIALDQYYFSELQNNAEHLRDGDGEVVSMWISMERDISNIMIILRSITHGYDAMRFIIPCPDSRITDLGRNTPQDVADAVTKLSKTVYGPLLEDAIPAYTETKSLLQVELALKRFLARKSKILMDEHPFQFAFILGFLKLKEPEVENLRAICIGIDGGLSADKIRELLITPA
jgi:vacuolar-type H+-ATPase subunit C/Vma6